MRSRIMYIENKSKDLNSMGRIGRVTFSKSGSSIYYGGMIFRKYQGYKSNYFEIHSGDYYWISGPKKFGGDRLYGTPGVTIDEDVAEEYWTKIRHQPQMVRELQD